MVSNVTEVFLAKLLKDGEIPIIYLECDLKFRVLVRDCWAFLNSDQVKEFMAAVAPSAKDAVKEDQTYSAYVEVKSVKPLAVGTVVAYGTDRAWERNISRAITADPEAFLIDLRVGKVTEAAPTAAKANVRKRVKNAAAPAAKRGTTAVKKTADETLEEDLEASLKQVRRRKPTGAATKAAPVKQVPVRKVAASSAPVPKAAAVRGKIAAKKAVPAKAARAVEAPKPQARRRPIKRA